MLDCAITAAGLTTPVGLRFESAAAALRAGIRDVQHANLWDAESGSYLTASKVALPQWSTGADKLADLLMSAVWECEQAALARSFDLARVPVIILLPPRDRWGPWGELDSKIPLALEARLQHSLAPNSCVIAGDRVGLLVALERARANMLHGGQACIVAGVDSYLRQDLALRYLKDRRLLTPLVSNGFTFGEAASAVLIEPLGNAPQASLAILGAGFAREPAPIGSGEPFRGEGLIAAIGAALAQACTELDALHYRISDMSGEHYKFKEMTFAMIRYERRPKPKLFDLWHPAESIGDVGAAFGPLLLAVALHAGRHGYQVGPRALITLGNDAGERGALVTEYRP